MYCIHILCGLCEACKCCGEFLSVNYSNSNGTSNVNKVTCRVNATLHYETKKIDDAYQKLKLMTKQPYRLVYRNEDNINASNHVAIYNYTIANRLAIGSRIGRA